MKRAVTAALFALGSIAVGAQQDWVQVGQDAGHTKYSTLDQINVGNVHRLQRAWTFNTGDKTRFFETTPLVKKSELPTSISPELTAYCNGLWEKYKLQDTVPYTRSPLSDAVVAFRLP